MSPGLVARGGRRRPSQRNGRHVAPGNRRAPYRTRLTGRLALTLFWPSPRRRSGRVNAPLTLTKLNAVWRPSRRCGMRRFADVEKTDAPPDDFAAPRRIPRAGLPQARARARRRVRPRRWTNARASVMGGDRGADPAAAGPRPACSGAAAARRSRRLRPRDGGRYLDAHLRRRRLHARPAGRRRRARARARPRPDRDRAPAPISSRGAAAG